MTPDEQAANARVGQAVKAARLAAGLTQTAVAAHLGLNRVSVANIESGRQGLTVHNLLRLHGLLGVELPGLAPADRHGDVIEHARLARENAELRRRLRDIRRIVENRDGVM